eukprot:Selendium_serpulae@DN3753_c0_g1_i1.p1
MGDAFLHGAKKAQQEPPRLLRIKALQAVLQAELMSEECVKEIMVFSIDGFLLACSSTTEAEHRVADAIAATLAVMYAGCPVGHTLLVDAEHGCGLVEGVHNSDSLLFCIWARPGAPVGMLKAKLKCLNFNISKHLEGIHQMVTD